jgi:hypothetical protein
LRFFPYGFLAGALRDAERRGQPGTVYIHPWELDPFIPDLPMSRIARFRTFGGAKNVWPRVSRLMSDFRFRTIHDTVRELHVRQENASRMVADREDPDSLTCRQSQQ